MGDRNDQVWQSPALAEKYLTGVRGAIPLATEQIDIILRVIASTAKPVTRFLDLGCGDGILGAAILEKYPTATGVFLDFSESMIKAAREQLKQSTSHLEFLVLDYANPQWVDSVTLAPFDLVVSGFSIHHQSDQRKQRLYHEIYQLLSPGSLFINVEHVASATKWIEKVWENYMIDSLEAMHSRQGSAKSRAEVAAEFYHRPDKDANILAPVADQCEWLRQIGFEDVDCYFKVFELAVFGGRRL